MQTVLGKASELPSGVGRQSIADEAASRAVASGKDSQPTIYYPLDRYAKPEDALRNWPFHRQLRRQRIADDYSSQRPLEGAGRLLSERR
jgi:hypothetical protein